MIDYKDGKIYSIRNNVTNKNESTRVLYWKYLSRFT